LLTVLIPLVMALLANGCVPAVSEAGLNEEFSLAPGQTMGITGEDLEVRFIEVSGDSRCATGVTCVWAGEVMAVTEIVMDGRTERLELTEPGLNDAPAGVSIQNYRFTFRVEPYPNQDSQIKPEDYRLMMVVSLPGD